MKAVNNDVGAFQLSWDVSVRFVGEWINQKGKDSACT